MPVTAAGKGWVWRSEDFHVGTVLGFQPLLNTQKPLQPQLALLSGWRLLLAPSDPKKHAFTSISTCQLL